MRFISNILFSFLAAISVAGCSAMMDYNEMPSHEKTTNVKVGDVAPDFTVTTLEGADVSLSDYQGKTVLLVFFSSWCVDCQSLMTRLNDVFTLFADRNFDILAVSRGEEKDVVSQFVTDIGCRCTVALDPDSSAFSLYATQFVPRCFIISPLGRIVAMSVEYNEAEFDVLLDIISSTAAKPLE